MTKIFQFWQKKLGITASCSTFSLAAHKTHVLKWGMFVSSDSVFTITQKLTMEYSEEILNVKLLASSSPSWTKSVFIARSSDQMGIGKSVCRLCGFLSLFGTDEWKQSSHGKMGRSSGRIQDVSFLPKNRGICSQDFRHRRFFKRSTKIQAERTSKPKSSKTRSSSSQCSMTLIGQKREWWGVYLARVKDYTMKFLQGHWTSWIGREVVKSSCSQKAEWDSPANKIVQRLKRNGSSRVQCLESWDPEQEKG